MKGTVYEGSNNARILAAVRECTLPDGASTEWMAARVRISSINLSKSLCFLNRKQGLIFAWKFGACVRYFATAEAREAAQPLLDELKARHIAAKRERVRKYDRAAYARMTPERKEMIRAAKAAHYLAARPERAQVEPKPPKPPKVAKPKPAREAKPVREQGLDAPVRIARPPAGGPARMPGDPVITSHTKFTYGPSTPSVLYRSNTHSVL